MDADIALENEALLAIYSDEIEFGSEGQCIYKYNVPQNSTLTVFITLNRSKAYPRELPAIHVSLNNASINKLQVAMSNRAMELRGSVMIFDLLTYAQDWITDNLTTIMDNESTERDVTSDIQIKTVEKIPEVKEQEEMPSDLDDSSEKPLLASREIPYRPQIDSTSYTPEELVQVQQEEVAKLADLLSIPRGVSQLLLNYYKWRSDKVMARYLSYPKDTLEEAGLNISNLKGSMSVPINSCELCMTDDLEKDEIISFETCSHAFCKDCYRSYVSLKIREDGSSFNITCAGYQCKTIIGQDIVKQLVDKPTYKMYSILLLKNYVDCSPYLRWCPGKYCRLSSVVKSEFLYNSYAKCSCGYAFCFECGNETHAPATCEMIANFTKSTRLEEEKSLVWLKTNTKLCPACKVFIQKNDGCNHMTCRRCGHEFCWVCNGPWKDHIGFYVCNRPKKVQVAYDDETQKIMDESAYYNHHYIRYENHQRSKSFAEKMVKVLYNTLQKYNNPLFEYGLEAASHLVLCRQILSCSYVFGYFLKDNERDMFDFLQQELEQTTEEFSLRLERWFRRPTSTPPSLLVTQTNTSQLRINALLDHVKYELGSDVRRERRRDKVELNLTVIPERVPPNDEELKLQQKIAELKLSRELKLSVEKERKDTSIEPFAVEEISVASKESAQDELSNDDIANILVRPIGTVFRRVCTNTVNNSYDIVPDEIFALLPGIVYVKRKYDVTAVLTVEGELWMLGNNECGQCGNYIEEDLYRRAPQKVQLPIREKVKQVDFGEYHTVALTESGNVYAWGQISNGKLGYDISVIDQISKSQQAYTRPKPYLVKFNGQSNRKIKKIACGRNHTICLDANGKVWGFGNGSFGQMGTGEEGNLDMMIPSILPQLARHYTNDIAAGAAYSLALTSESLFLIGSCQEDEPNAYARHVCERGRLEVRLFASEHAFFVLQKQRDSSFLLSMFRDLYNKQSVEIYQFGIEIVDAVASSSCILVATNFGMMGSNNGRLSTQALDYPSMQGAQVLQVGSSEQPFFLIAGGLGQISSDLGQAFISGLTKAFSDIQFTIEHEGTTQDFFVNKAVLAARSDYFKKMFAADPQLRVIPVKGVPPDVFRVFLLFIYCDSVFEPAICNVNLNILAKLASRYKFQYLEDQCYYLTGGVCPNLSNSNLMNFPQNCYSIYSTIAQDISKIVMMPEFSDIEVKVQQKTYKLHKFILSARCPYFHKMFDHNSSWQESKAKLIELHDMESATFEQILSYIYNDKMSFYDMGVVAIAEIFVHAHELCLGTLYKFAESLLERLVNKTNVCQLLTLGSLYGSQALLDSCIEFIRKYFTSIPKAEFNALSESESEYIKIRTGRRV